VAGKILREAACFPRGPEGDGLLPKSKDICEINVMLGKEAAAHPREFKIPELQVFGRLRPQAAFIEA
jgi:hypothetical protein